MSRSETLPALTSLRFFAAMWVVLFHGILYQGAFYDRVVHLGFVAVPFFFLLSGFILGRVYLMQGQPVDTKRFLVSRFARIYPLYLLTLLIDLPRYLHVAAAVNHSDRAASVSTIAASIFAVQAWSSRFYGLNSPSWSVSVEVFFYILFPFIGPALWKVPKRWLVPSMFLLIVFALAVTALTTSPEQVTYDPLRHLPTFMVGILLSRYSATLLADVRKRELLERCAPGLILLGLVLLLSATRLAKYPAFLQSSLLAPIFSVLILAFTVKGRLTRILSMGWLVLLGESSFGLYLIHMPLKAIVRVPLEKHFDYVFPAYLLSAVCLSILSFKYLERPARTWILKQAGYIPKENLLASSIAQ